MSQFQAKTARSFELHRVLKNYRKFQREKSVLTNRINNMNFNKKRNLNKVDLLNKKLQQLKTVRDSTIAEKQMMRKSISESKLNQLNKKKTKLNQIKEQQRNTTASKVRLLKHKSDLTHRVRSQSRSNQTRITISKQNFLQQKIVKNHKIRENQRISKSRIQLKLNQKLDQIRNDSERKLINYAQILRREKMEVDAMKELQKSIVMQYSKSLVSLKQSRSKFSPRMIR